MSEHTPEELHEFAAKHAPKLAEKITQLCGAVIARGMTGILEEVCRIQQEADSLRALNAELLEALGKARSGLSNGLWDYGPGQDEHAQCNELIEEVDAAIAKANALKGDSHEQS